MGNSVAFSYDQSIPITSVHLIKRDLFGNIIEWRLEAFADTTQPFKYETVVKYGRYGVDHSFDNAIKTIVVANSIKDYNSQIMSIVDRKCKMGYKYIQDYPCVDDLPQFNTDANNLCKPMKCQPFKESRFVQGMLGQGKVNGVRAIIMFDPNAKSEGLFDEPKHVKILSKEGLVYNIAHIEAIFKKVYEVEENRNIVFDGEIYIPNEYVTSIGGAARNPKNPLHSRLCYIVFDLAIPLVEQAARLSEMEYVLNDRIDGITMLRIDMDINKDIHTPVVVLGSTTINSVDQCVPFMDRMIEQGFEGAVFRHPNVIYKFGSRPTTMVKLKKSKDSEFLIIDILFDKGDNNIGASLIYVLQNDLDTQTFNCTGMGTVSEKETIYAERDQHIGKKATVKFFERTKFGLPFHANVIGIRDYE